MKYGLTPNISISNFFPTCLTTLKKTSYDSEKDTYMTEKCFPVVNFDLVKNIYRENRNLVEANTPKSCDALYENRYGHLFFIEFKNSSNRKTLNSSDLKIKAYNSMIILCDILDKKFSELSENVSFLVVYNDKESNQKQSPRKNVIPLAPAFDRLATQITQKSEEQRLVKFKLGSLKTFCFKDVSTFTQEEFEEYTVKLHGYDPKK